MDKGQYTAEPDLRHSPRRLSSLRSNFAPASPVAAKGSPLRLRTNASATTTTTTSASNDDSRDDDGIELLGPPQSQQPTSLRGPERGGGVQDPSDATAGKRKYKLGSKNGSTSPRKPEGTALGKRIGRIKPLDLETVPARNKPREEKREDSVVTITDTSNANEGEAVGSDNDTTTTTTTATTTRLTLLDETEGAVAHAYFDNKRSALLDLKRAEDMEQVPKSISNGRPNTKREANEEVKKAQERTKKLMANSNVAEELSNAVLSTRVTTRSHTTRSQPRTRYDVRGKQQVEKNSAPPEPPRRSTSVRSKPKAAKVPVVITIDDDDSMSQDSLVEEAPPRKRARTDTPTYYASRVVFGLLDCAEEQWEIRWEAAELVIRTVKRLNAADDDGDDPLAALDFPGNDDDDEYSPDGAKRRKKQKSDKKKAAKPPRAAEPADKDFHVAFSDLASLGVLPSSGLVAVKTRTLLSEIDSDYYDPQNRDGTRHFIHIYCTNLDEWREEWARVVHLLKGTTVKVNTITEATLEDYNIGAMDRQTIIPAQFGRRHTRSMSRGITARRAASAKKVITYPPGRSRDVVTLTEADVERLDPEQLLNDNIIEFYLKYLHEEALFPGKHQQQQREQFYFFNTFFWPKLQSSKEEAQMIKLLSWTRKVDIFKKRFLFVPINDGFHWTMVVICNPGSIVRAQTAADWDALPTEECPIMIHMCSLNTSGRHLFQKLRSYLQVAWNNEKVPQGEPPIKVNPETIKGYVPHLPEQQNGSDCGVFLLQYVEGFCRNPPALYTKEALGLTLRSDWFDNETIIQKRREIKDLIARIACEQAPVTDEPEQAGGAAGETASTNSADTASATKSGLDANGDLLPPLDHEREVTADRRCSEEEKQGEGTEDRKKEESLRRETHRSEDEDEEATQLPEFVIREEHEAMMELEEEEDDDDNNVESEQFLTSPWMMDSPTISSEEVTREAAETAVEKETAGDSGAEETLDSGRPRPPGTELLCRRVRRIVTEEEDEDEDEDKAEPLLAKFRAIVVLQKRAEPTTTKAKASDDKGVEAEAAEAAAAKQRDVLASIPAPDVSIIAHVDDDATDDDEDDTDDDDADDVSKLRRLREHSDKEERKKKRKRQKREEDGSSGLEEDSMLVPTTTTTTTPTTPPHISGDGSVVVVDARTSPADSVPIVIVGGDAGVVEAEERGLADKRERASRERTLTPKKQETSLRGASGAKGRHWAHLADEAVLRPSSSSSSSSSSSTLQRQSGDEAPTALSTTTSVSPEPTTPTPTPTTAATEEAHGSHSGHRRKRKNKSMRKNRNKRKRQAANNNDFHAVLDVEVQAVRQTAEALVDGHCASSEAVQLAVEVKEEKPEDDTYDLNDVALSQAGAIDDSSCSSSSVADDAIASAAKSEQEQGNKHDEDDGTDDEEDEEEDERDAIHDPHPRQKRSLWPAAAPSEQTKVPPTPAPAEMVAAAPAPLAAADDAVVVAAAVVKNSALGRTKTIDDAPRKKNKNKSKAASGIKKGRGTVMPATRDLGRPL